MYRLMTELHDLHARAGRPSLAEIVARQDRTRDKRDHFSRDTVHRLFSKARKAPPLPLLYEVVRILGTMAPRVDIEDAQERFDQMWLAADRYDALQLNLQVPQARDCSELGRSPDYEAWGGRDE